MVVLKYEKEVNRLLEKYLKDDRVRKHFAELQDSAAIHAEHSQRVAAVSLDVALEAKIPECPQRICNYSIIDIIGIGGLLHDIGKCDIPDSVLNKPGKHTAWEREVMQAHTRRGFLRLKELDPICYIAVAHHERKVNPYPRDGRDRRLFPRGIPDRRTPPDEFLDWSVELIAGTDIVDALTDVHRKYKHKLTLQRVEEIARGEYTGDPRLLDRIFPRYDIASTAAKREE